MRRAAEQRRREPPLRGGEWVGQTVLLVIAVGALFGAAGTFGWMRGWLYLAVLVAGLLGHGAYVKKRNPELREARRRIGPGTKKWDVVWNAAFWVLMLAEPVAAALETVRFAHAPLPVWTFAAGVAVLYGGLAISARAMAVNPFFEGTVRIQTDRGQYVVQSGPYARLRHPGYLGLELWALGTPLLLGSRWACVAAALTAAWIVVRTVLEDRTLQRELPGYAEYARRVPYRLVPLVW